MTPEETNNIAAIVQQVSGEWETRFGDVGAELARDMRKIVDLLLEYVDENYVTEEKLRSMVAPWALQGSDELIPLSKISKEGLERLLANPGYITDGELIEILASRHAGNRT